MLPSFSSFKNFVFDLDGTVWYWDQLVPGVKETMEALREEGKGIYFVTNNSMLSPGGFVRRLENLGLKTDPGRVVCSPEIILQYLRKAGAKRIYCLSLKETLEYFLEEGLETGDDPDYVLIIYNKGDEGMLEKAAEFMSGGVPAITNGRGKVWALKDRRLPGTGVYVEKVEKLSDRMVEVVGKPSDFSVDYTRKKFNLNPGETIFFGDSLNSDFKFARKLGWAFAFVLTGEYNRVDLKNFEKPDFVLESMADILE